MTLRVRVGGYQPERSVHTRAMRTLERELTDRSGGEIAVEFTPQITAHGRQAADLLTLTESGDLDICYFASSYVAGRVPELSILDLPFEGADRARAWQRLDGDVGARLKAAVDRRTPYEVLAFWDNGVRHISNGVRPIRRPEDCRGLTIRTLDNRFHQAIFAALGFEPRFIDVKDLAEAVASRRIDAQENPLTNIVNFEIQKTHRFVSLTGQFHGIALVLANRRFLETLAPAVRGLLDAAMATATALQRTLAAGEDDQCQAQLAGEGVEVVPAGEIDLPAFKAAVASAVEEEARLIDPSLRAAWAG